MPRPPEADDRHCAEPGPLAHPIELDQLWWPARVNYGVAYASATGRRMAQPNAVRWFLMRFLRRNASPVELASACFTNHVEWLRRLTEAGGGVVSVEDGMVWATTRRPAEEVVVAVADPRQPDLRERIDAIRAHCQANRIHALSFWVADDAQAHQLDIWLSARGMVACDRPMWMALDLLTRPVPEPPRTASPVTLPDRLDDWTVPGLLCYDPASKHVRQAMLAPRPQRVWHAVWWHDEKPVGNVSLNVTDGELGVVGVHDWGFVPAARTAGLGLDRCAGVIPFVRELGCRYLVARSAGETAPLCRALGFGEVGRGLMWTLPYQAGVRAPEPGQVAVAEAIGSGDIAELSRLVGTPDPAVLDRALANGLTPLRFAADHGQPAVAQWLLSHGATADPIALWSLGWRDQVRQMLAASPALAREPGSPTRQGLLQQAVERDDIDLAELLLSCGADPHGCASGFDVTPLDTATELRRWPMVATLRGTQTRVFPE